MKIHPISRGELWLAQGVLFAAILLQVFVWGINPDLTYGPHGLIVITELALSVIIGLSASTRHLRPSPVYRTLSIVLLGLISLANITSFFLVARLLIADKLTLSGRELLVSAIAIFLTNIIVFALWYWEIDSPGLTGRKWSKHDKDFQFTQQDMPRDFPDWQPSFIDYLYLSITNAINFAAADAKPITTQAKSLMGAQALISVFTLALILARSISILG
jgi:predicted neutral ceramidase superfamily lipid hydrolase